MKGYYIHFDARDSIGVSNKIDMQISAFRKKYEIEEVCIHANTRRLFERIITLLPGGYIKRTYIDAIKKIKDPNFIYIRRATADSRYFKFIRQIKMNYPNCKVIVEIFTYPYDRDEFAKWNAWPFYFKDIYYRKRLKKYIDRYVTYSVDEKIFGVKTIQTINGIDVYSVSLPVCGNDGDKTIRMIAVAVLQKHHGYERILNGLAEYYRQGGKRNIQFKVVGDGPELQYYKDIVKDNRLQNHVEFKGQKKGKELADEYNNMDIGVISFGMYKLGIYSRLSALKSREYLAKGLPIVTGCSIDILENKEYKYCVTFSNDDTKIDINRLIAFYDKIYGNETHKSVQDNIRRFAKKTVDIDSTMLPIIDFISEK